MERADSRWRNILAQAEAIKNGKHAPTVALAEEILRWHDEMQRGGAMPEEFRQPGTPLGLLLESARVAQGMNLQEADAIEAGEGQVTGAMDYRAKAARLAEAISKVEGVRTA